MAAHFDSRVQPAKRAWAPRTADLDNLSTSDIREDHTSDFAAVRTHDVARPDVPDEPDKPRVLPPLMQPAAALTSDLEPKTEAPASPVHSSAQQNEAPRGVREGPVAIEAARTARSDQRKSVAGVSPGAVLKDRYLIERALGAGGTAWVFRARDLTAQKDAPDARVAIKTPRPDVKDPVRAIARLQHEFKHARGLAHPNIARVLELSSDEQTWFMTMELIEGRSLATLIREPTSLPNALKGAVLTSCAQALAYAHSKDVVHGDFKPSNVIVSPGGQVKVFDFGAATSPEGEDTRIPAGTPAYASPQVLSGATPDPRDDVFSFGCVAYEVLTGRHPFARRSSLEAREHGQLPERAANLSAAQWLSLVSALAWERDERPHDIEKFAATLLTASSPPSLQAERIASESVVATTPRIAATETSDQPLAPPQRSWGFFAFLVCALGLIYIGTQRQTDSGEADDEPERQIAHEADFQIAPAGLMGAPVERRSANGASSGAALGLGTSAGGLPMSVPDERAKQAPVEPARVQKPARAPLSEISFESATIATSESSLAAVFVIKRSPPLSQNVQIRWRAVSGTAEAGVDFASDAIGTVEFLDGQTQRAIYVPLRNDELQEGDETFSLELEVLRGGRAAQSTAQATILDDD